MMDGSFNDFSRVFFEILVLDLIDHFMEQLDLLVHEKSKEGSHRLAAEIGARMIRGSKDWILEMVCLKIDQSTNHSIHSSNFISHGSLCES
jgi:hypothetical protein